MDGLFTEADAPEASAKKSETSGAYRVLARKYRPRSFEDLVGQEAMIKTLSNAFETGRIAQGYMLTGVRGVGKTTTARILARGLNYEIPGKVDRPTIHMPELGLHCQAIMEGRHVDVIEMDAASHTSINDIREITEAARYKPVSARMKVYIIDEVHMLSTAAFNGLLKTLEEPPEHVKFIFATTEIRKVPITILSRCQRFDLRRIEADVLIGLLKRICAAEGASVSDEALRLIAKAAEGSARDSLSLLDQAIAQGVGEVGADDVRAMLGLADRTRVIDLFEHVMKGDAAAALSEMGAQFAVGADPAVVLADLAEFTHFVTRLKVVGDSVIDGTVSEVEATRGQTFAGGLGVRVLGRAWQILLKGLEEVRTAPKALSAAEMVLIRLCFAADLPTPDDALKLLSQMGSGGGGAAGGGNGGGTGGGAPRASLGLRAVANGDIAPQRPAPRLVTSQPIPAGEVALAPSTSPSAVPETRIETRPETRIEAPAPTIFLPNLETIAALAAEKRDLKLKLGVERQIRLVRMEQGSIEVSLTPDAPKDLPQDLARKLSDWTGIRWMVAISRETGGETIHEMRTKARENLVQDARAEPTVASILKRFPGAKVVDVRVHRSAEEERMRGMEKTADGDIAVPEPGEGMDDNLDGFDLFEVDDPGWAPE